MKVEQIDFAITFTRDNSIVLRQGPKLKALSDRLKGQIATINAPELSPPELPRLVVRIEDGLLQVALSRYQLAVKPPNHIAASYVESMDFAANVARPIFAELTQAIDKTFEWSGAVVVLNFPRDRRQFPTGVKAVAPVARRLTTLDWSASDLITFELKIGKKVGSFYRNYAMTGYDIKELQVQAKRSAQQIQIDSADFAGARTSESGVTITVDVNSRPDPKLGDPVRDLSSVVAEHRRAIDSLESDLNLVGAL